MDPRMIGLVGGIGGAVIGIMGGAIGTYFSIKNTAGPRERAFMIRSSVVAWIAVSALLVALGFASPIVRAMLWGLYGISLGAAIRLANRRQERIRREEASIGPDGSAPGPCYPGK